MKVDTSESAYKEHADAAEEFDPPELRRLRLILRRLQFLEAQVKKNGGLRNGGGASGGAAFVEWEIDALEWILKEVGFL